MLTGECGVTTNADDSTIADTEDSANEYAIANEILTISLTITQPLMIPCNC